MSLSKSYRRSQRCYCLLTRQYKTGNVSSHKRMQVAAKIFTMSQHFRNVNQLQLKNLKQMKDYVVKATSELNIIDNINKEWVKVVQRLPSIFGPHEQAVQEKTGASEPISDVTKVNGTVPKQEHEEKSRLKIPSYLNGIMPFGTKQAEVLDDASPKWRKKEVAVSKTCIDARTRHVIASLRCAETRTSRFKRLEDLTSHLNEYPQAKDLAVKEGAVSLLLNLRRNESKEDDVQNVIREGLSLLGHVDPLPARGIRILSMDGGGTRGVVVIEMLRKIERLTGKRVHELFDYICGVSTGAILACLLGPHKKSLEECSDLYRELSAKIFNQSPIWGTSSLVWSHAYYDTRRWEGLLKYYLGDVSLVRTARDPSCPKMAAISTVVHNRQVLAYVFRNYNLPYGMQSQYMGSSRHLMWEAVRASAAAPSYFEEFTIGDFHHQDGAILVNNPTAVAIHEARHLWPDSPLQCVLSLGTGREKHAGMPLPHVCRTRMVELASGNDGESIAPFDKVSPTKDAASSGPPPGSSLKTKLQMIFDSATDTEGVHTILSDLLPRDVYFRFNPHLTEYTGLDEIRPEVLNRLETDAAMYVRRNEETFRELADVLLSRKTVMQKCVDWAKLRYIEGLPSILSQLDARWRSKK